MQGCGLRDRARDFDRANAVVLGVSFDEVEDNRAFAGKFSFPYPLLSDPDRSMGLAWGAADEPGRGGYAKRIAYLVGPDGIVRHVWPKANPQTFAAEALGLLGAG